MALALERANDVERVERYRAIRAAMNPRVSLAIAVQTLLRNQSFEDPGFRDAPARRVDRFDPSDRSHSLIVPDEVADGSALGSRATMSTWTPSATRSRTSTYE